MSSDERPVSTSRGSVFHSHIEAESMLCSSLMATVQMVPPCFEPFLEDEGVRSGLENGDCSRTTIWLLSFSTLVKLATFFIAASWAGCSEGAWQGTQWAHGRTASDGQPTGRWTDGGDGLP